MNVIDYKIITATTSLELESYVQYQIKQGWKPQGGVSYNGASHIQAMVKVHVPEIHSEFLK